MTIRRLNQSKNGAFLVLPINLQDSILIGDVHDITGSIIGYVNNNKSTILITDPLTDYAIKNDIHDWVVDDLKFHYPDHKIVHRVFNESLGITLWGKDGSMALSPWIDAHLDSGSLDVFEPKEQGVNEDYDPLEEDRLACLQAMDDRAK